MCIDQLGQRCSDLLKRVHLDAVIGVSDGHLKHYPVDRNRPDFVVRHSSAEGHQCGDAMAVCRRVHIDGPHIAGDSHASQINSSRVCRLDGVEIQRRDVRRNRGADREGIVHLVDDEQGAIDDLDSEVGSKAVTKDIRLEPPSNHFSRFSACRGTRVFENQRVVVWIRHGDGQRPFFTGDPRTGGHDACHLGHVEQEITRVN